MSLGLTALIKQFTPSPLQVIHDNYLDAQGIELWIKRDDCLHPIISGNKWRKLKYSVNHALSLNVDTLISMGGAYSNHLHALAYLGKLLPINTIGLIRGEPPLILTPTLHDMQSWGMQLRYVSRSDYRNLRHYRQWHELPDLQTGQYWLVEGGAQAFALLGIAEIITEIDISYDWLCVACGTGTTLAGLRASASADISVLGIAALKNNGFLEKDINQLIPENNKPYYINNNYAFGGFAKTSPELLNFMAEFEYKTAITLEPVYTGKLFYALYDLIKQGYFKRGQRIIALHTGGLQGNRGFKKDGASKKQVS
ncbi:MAG: pyridoxal-phosphate dependent enzyme [Methylococcaceae bacterium]